MSDKKISQLTASTTPLAGSEILPVVQSGATKQVSVANLTAGRAVSVASLASTGNIVSDTLVRVTNAGQIEQNSGAGGLYFLNSAVTGGATNMRFLTTDTSGVAQTVITLIGGTSPISQFFGDVKAETGNFVIGTAGKGIDFSADPNAGGMTSELLDDYEEGTWTPTDASGAGLTLTDTSNNCFYTKIGRVVTATFSLVFPSTADASSARIGGLPFNSLATTNNPQGGFFTEQAVSAGAVINLTQNANSFIILTTGTTSIVTNATLSTKTLRGVIVYQV